MAPQQTENLAPEAHLALAYTPPIMREALRIFLEFDFRLGRIVSQTSEVMLGQMRLAWWRDTLGTDVADRPAGDEVLDAINAHWRGHEAALIAVADGWEHMLAEPPLPRASALEFAAGRGEGLAGCAALAGVAGPECDAVRTIGQLWALTDAASHVAQADERATLLNLAREVPAPERLGSPLRGVAVLGALAQRSLENDGAPLMAGRGAALVAMRAGLLGR
ncbi:MAG: hypothetical protein WBA51_14225 [Erythrobacter sp.]